MTEPQDDAQKQPADLDKVRIHDLRAFLRAPKRVDLDDPDQVARWLADLAEKLAETDTIVIVQEDHRVQPPGPRYVPVTFGYSPDIKLCPGKMPGIPETDDDDDDDFKQRRMRLRERFKGEPRSDD